jgi:gas vesicle protein
MVDTGQFHPKAMRQYINKLKVKPYKTEEEYCERNADYIKYIYMNTCAHHNHKEAAQLWADTKRSLMNELKEFKDNLDKHRKQSEDMKALNAQERRDELTRYINELQK